MINVAITLILLLTHTKFDCTIITLQLIYIHYFVGKSMCMCLKTVSFLNYRPHLQTVRRQSRQNF